ncbi:MAG TPA: hypothetical protein VHH15_06065 [Actinophytocola sp.]|nr:hypothetical protein [Actinophytocola sp.]
MADDVRGQRLREVRVVGEAVGGGAGFVEQVAGAVPVTGAGGGIAG